MVVISFLILAVPLCFTFYWIGRGAKLNRKIRDQQDDVAYSPKTGEVIERGTPEWDVAVKQKHIVRFIEDDV